MVPFYEAMKGMVEDGWFYHRAIIESSARGGFPGADRLHIGTFRRLSKFVMVVTDEHSNIDQFNIINDYRDDDDNFARDWDKTCCNSMYRYRFPKSRDMLLKDKLEYDVWPDVFSKVRGRIHPVFFEETIKAVFFDTIKSKFGEEEALSPVLSLDLDDFRDHCQEQANTLISRIRKSGVKHGIRRCTGVRFKLVARGFTVELNLDTTYNKRPKVVKQVYLMESRKDGTIQQSI